jgi:hypothetical protein
MRIAAEWHTDAPPGPEGSRPLRVFAQLLDDSNHIVGQYDGSPAVEPSSTWPARVPRRGQFGLPVLPGTLPGTYRLIVGLFDAETMARLPLPDSTDALTLASIRVERPSVPPTVDSLDTAVRRPLPLGHVHLLGWRFNKLGFDSVPETPLRPGEPLSVVLFWKAMAVAPTVPPLALQLIAPSGQTIVEQPWTPVEGRYAPNLWEAGEVVRDPQVYFIPGNLAPGRYRLALSGGQQRIVLGNVAIEP